MTVHLVGAGPGDPGLITARGLDLVRTCDILVADALVAPELVDEAPDDALVISRADMKQDAVTSLLVAYGAAGLDVVRLKGGDPFVFGRGGEEALALAEAGIPFEVVPASRRSQRCPLRRSSPSPTAASPTASRSRAGTARTAASRTTPLLPLRAERSSLFMGLGRLAQLCRASSRQGCRRPPRLPWSREGRCRSRNPCRRRSPT